MKNEVTHRTTLDCGIAMRRIAAWLDDELEAPESGGAWVFEAEGCECNVTLSPLEGRPIGPIALERTSLTIEGDAPAVQAFMRLFTLRFMSAGG